jgi:hypothetical protein
MDDLGVHVSIIAYTARVRLKLDGAARYPSMLGLDWSKLFGGHSASPGSRDRELGGENTAFGVEF